MDLIGGDTAFGCADEPLLDRTSVGPEKSECVSLEVVSMDVLRIATADILLVLADTSGCGDELNMMLSEERGDTGLEKEGLGSDAGD